MRALDVGCGRNKRPGAYGLDSNRDADADVVADVDRGAWPFRDDSFDQIWLTHVIEHVEDVVRTVEEAHRVARPGARLYIETPHYSDFSSFCDPTHRWHLTSFSFRYFTDDYTFNYYSRKRLRELGVHVELLRPWRWLGLQWLINRSRAVRKWWEFYLCFVIRGKAMRFEFEVLKPAPEDAPES